MSDLSLGVSVGGVGEAIAAMQRVGQATTQAAAQTSASASATRSASEAASAASQSTASFGQQLQTGAARVAGMANAVQSLTQRLGIQNQAAGLVGSIASTTAQFASMGALIGPQGAVAGAVIGFAVSLYELRDAHSAVAEAASAQSRAEHDLATASAAGGDQSTHDLAVRLQTQRTLMADHQAELVDITTGNTRRLAELSDMTNPAVVLGLVGGAVAGFDERAATLRQQIEADRVQVGRADAALQGSVDDPTGLGGLSAGSGPQFGRPTAPAGRPRPRARRGGGGGRDSGASAERERNAADLADLHGTIDRQYAEDSDNRTANYEGEIAAAQEAAQLLESQKSKLLDARAARRQADEEAAAAQRELNDAAREAIDLFNNGYSNSIDQVVRQWQHANTAIRAAGGQMISTAHLLERGMVATGNSIAETIGGTMKGAFESALGAWLDGSKSFVQAAEEMAKGVLKALVTEAIVQGVVELARGIADLASYHYDSAALHFGAAAAWAAVGVVAGGVGAAVGAFGGGGASAGGGATTRDTASASREAQSQQQQGPMVFNIYPGGYITKADVAAGLVDALNAHSRTQGGSLSPRIMRAA